MRRPGLRLDQAPPLHLPLRFFLTAPLFGMGAGVLLIRSGSAGMTTPWALETLVMTHFITLGFISMVMVGALYQITPVLLGSPVPWVGLARWVHLGLTLGIAAMAGGLLTLSPLLLSLALIVLLSAFLIFFLQMFAALLRVSSLTATAVSVGVAVGSLALTVPLGLLFLGEYGFGWLGLERWTLTAVHIYLALGGWVGAMITGVGQVVIPMFYLSGSFPRPQARSVLAGLVLLVVSGTGTAFFAPSTRWHLLPLGFAAFSVAVFILAVHKMLRGRKRKVVDPTLRCWQLGMICVPWSLAALAVYTLLPEPRWLLVFGVLYLLGFATPIIIGMLYKIVPFLIWLHRYSHLAGNADVPLMRDIIPPRFPQWQWWSHLAMVVLLAGAALTAGDALTRLAGALLTLSCGGLFVILLNAARIKVLPVEAEQPPPPPRPDEQE